MLFYYFIQVYPCLSRQETERSSELTVLGFQEDVEFCSSDSSCSDNTCSSRSIAQPPEYSLLSSELELSDIELEEMNKHGKLHCHLMKIS